ncbi:hypothetical protein [Rhodopirellula sallentina]|uniref:Uncharacterized protein n=1 Tax=Rhodopirellula sallentina SM41 TaxID=1263870 RepID=M5TWB4_9BACT|nr:hypothetical protein [Rhodopirellula sallentina]EMI53502.1 hypothetical protein RSSM_05056 [Rhodopirellula sallentina SM41]
MPCPQSNCVSTARESLVFWGNDAINALTAIGPAVTIERYFREPTLTVSGESIRHPCWCERRMLRDTLPHILYRSGTPNPHHEGSLGIEFA